MRNCFIPGCDKLCRMEGTVKRKMFVVPRDKETFEKWVKILPKQRELKPHDKVCERHFDEQDISTTYDNNINGLIYKMERGRAKLKPKAVPTRNMEYAEKSSRNKRTIIINSTKAKMRVVGMAQENIQVFPYPKLVDEEQQLELDGEVQEITERPTEVPMKEQTIESYEEALEQAKKQIQVSDSQVQEFFESLYDDIYEVVLPNTLWGVHRCPEHSSIFFSFIDPGMLRTTKMISISSQGEIKVLFGSRLMSEQNLITDIASVESLIAMIAEIDEVLLCSKMFHNEFCEVSLKDSNSGICAPCAEFENV